MHITLDVVDLMRSREDGQTRYEKEIKKQFDRSRIRMPVETRACSWIAAVNGRLDERKMRMLASGTRQCISMSSRADIHTAQSHVRSYVGVGETRREMAYAALNVPGKKLIWVSWKG